MTAPPRAADLAGGAAVRAAPAGPGPPPLRSGPQDRRYTWMHCPPRVAFAIARRRRPSRCREVGVNPPPLVRPQVSASEQQATPDPQPRRPARRLDGAGQCLSTRPDLPLLVHLVPRADAGAAAAEAAQERARPGQGHHLAGGRGGGGPRRGQASRAVPAGPRRPPADEQQAAVAICDPSRRRGAARTRTARRGKTPTSGRPGSRRLIRAARRSGQRSSASTGMPKGTGHTSASSRGKSRTNRPRGSQRHVSWCA